MLPEPEGHVCDVPDCVDTNTTPCRLPMYRGDAPLPWFIRNYGLRQGLHHIWQLLRYGFTDTTDYYCWKHAKKNGFCPGCGEFWAGCESFDFSQSGLCENCKDELASDLDDDEEGDWSEYLDEDYYDDLTGDDNDDPDD
jgi:hypothetical protein